LQQWPDNINGSSVLFVYDVRKEIAETCYRFFLLPYSTLTSRSTTTDSAYSYFYHKFLRSELCSILQSVSSFGIYHMAEY